MGCRVRDQVKICIYLFADTGKKSHTHTHTPLFKVLFSAQVQKCKAKGRDAKYEKESLTFLKFPGNLSS